MSSPQPTPGKLKCLGDTARTSARRGVLQRSSRMTIELDEGIPVVSVDIKALAACDPAQGILPLLIQPSASF